MRKLIGFVLAVCASCAAQIPAPQINLTGNIGCQGFPCVNNGILIFSSDADRTMTAQETSAFYIKATSSTSLTATRNLISPTGAFPFTIENATTGAQAIQIIGASGTGVTIPNGATVSVWNDGTNFVQIGSAASGSNQTQSNYSVEIQSYTVGSGYTSPSFSVTGGTCTTPPVLGYDVSALQIHGSVNPYITNASSASCTLAPSVTVNDGAGTGATVTLEVQPSWPTIGFTGLFNGNQTQNGGGPVLGSITPLIDRPFLHNPVLEPIVASGNNTAYESVDCGGLGTNIFPWIYFPGTNPVYSMNIYNPCQGNLTFSPFSFNSIYSLPAITFGRNSLNSGTQSQASIQINAVSQTSAGFNGIDLNPMVSPTLALPQRVGITASNKNTGGTLNPSKGVCGGSSYTVPGTCALSGGTRTGGSADTCSVSLSGTGGLACTVTTNGIWTIPPTLTITGASGGSGAIVSGSVGIANPNSIAGSFGFDLSQNFFVSTQAAESNSGVVSTISPAGILTISGVSAPSGGSGSNCWATDGSIIAGCAGGGSLPAGGGYGTVIQNGSTNPSWGNGGNAYSLPGNNYIGDSITGCNGSFAPDNPGGCYVNLMNAQLGANGTNVAVTGSQAADMVAQAYSLSAPSRTGNMWSTVLCCVNDANTLGTNAGGVANATAELYSLAANRTIPVENTISGGNYSAASCTTSGTVATGTYGNVTTLQLQSAGASLSCTTLTSSTALYLNWLATYNGTQQATVVVDGGSPVTVNGYGFSGQTVGTINNPTNPTMFAQRFVGTGSGTHTFIVTCTANCTSGNGFVFGWEGAPTQIINTNLSSLTQNPPRLALGGTIRQSADTSSAATAAYDTVVQTVANQLLADGALDFFVNVRAFVDLDYATLNSDMAAATLPNGCATIASSLPGLHPNSTTCTIAGNTFFIGGHPHLADAFLSVMQPMFGPGAGLLPNLRNVTSGTATFGPADGTIWSTVPIVIPAATAFANGREFRACSETSVTQTLTVGSTNLNVPNVLQPFTCVDVQDQYGTYWLLVNPAKQAVNLLPDTDMKSGCGIYWTCPSGVTVVGGVGANGDNAFSYNLSGTAGTGVIVVPTAIPNFQLGTSYYFGAGVNASTITGGHVYVGLCTTTSCGTFYHSYQAVNGTNQRVMSAANVATNTGGPYFAIYLQGVTGTGTLTVSEPLLTTQQGDRYTENDNGWGSLPAGGIQTNSIAINSGTAITSESSANSQVVTCATGGTSTQYCGADGNWHTPSGAGTVTSFSAGNLSPLFTSSVATATSTPALSFSLSNAAQNSVLAGPASGGAGAPSYQTAPTISAANMTSFPTLNQNTTGTASNLSGTPALPNGTTATTQALADNSTDIATDQFVLANAAGSGTVSSCGTAGGMFRAASTGTTATCDPQSLSDGAGNLTVVSVKSGGGIANDGTTGTLQAHLAKINSAGNCILPLTTDTTVPAFPVETGYGTTGNCYLSPIGVQNLVFENTAVANDWVVTGTTTRGDVHDSGTAYTSAPPTGVWIVGIAVTAGTGTQNVLLTPQYNSSGGGITTPVSIANGGTGTGSTLTGLMRGNSSAMTAAELSGDVTTSGSNAATVVQIEGAAIPASATLVGTNSSKQLVAVTTPLAVANGGTGTSSPALVAGTNVTITGSWPNQTINSSGGGGGSGGSALNPDCTFSASATSCTISVAGLTVPNANYNSIITQCWTGASTTQTTLAITSYAYATGATYVSTVTPSFLSAAAAGYCTANLTSGGVNSFTGDSVVLNNSASTGSVTATLANAPAYDVLQNDTSGSAAPTYGKLDLAHSITGTLPVANGGTGQTSLSALFNACTPTTNTSLGTDLVGNQSGATVLQVFNDYCTVTTASTANTIDGTHHGIDLKWTFDFTSNATPTWQLTFGICPTANISGHTCSSGFVNLYQQTAGTITSATAIGNGAEFTVVATATPGEFSTSFVRLGVNGLGGNPNTGSLISCGSACTGGSSYSFMMGFVYSATGSATCLGQATSGTNCAAATAMVPTWIQ